MPVVTVYTKPGCPECSATHLYMNQHKIDHQIVDLGDPEALAYVESLGYSSAPVVVAGEQHWSGFRIDRIKGLRSPAVEPSGTGRIREYQQRRRST